MRCLKAAGTKTMKLIAYCRKRISKAGMPTASLLSALMMAAHRNAEVISTIPIVRLCAGFEAITVEALLGEVVPLSSCVFAIASAPIYTARIAILPGFPATKPA